MKGNGQPRRVTWLEGARAGGQPAQRGRMQQLSCRIRPLLSNVSGSSASLYPCRARHPASIWSITHDVRAADSPVLGQRPSPLSSSTIV